MGIFAAGGFGERERERSGLVLEAKMDLKKSMVRIRVRAQRGGREKGKWGRERSKAGGGASSSHSSLLFGEDFCCWRELEGEGLESVAN